MKIKTLVSVSALTAVLVGCGDGGDIKINADTVDNSVDNSSGGGGGPVNNNCATFVKNDQQFQGEADTSNPANCVYGVDFVDLTNPLVSDNQITFEDLPDNGVHVFRGSLVVGRNYDNDAELATAGITEGGDGTILRLEAGVTLAFQSNEDYMVINRGSQIFAEGTAAEPVTVTSVSDAVDGTVGPEDVQQWGGMIINGFAVTNKCAYTAGVNRGAPGFATTDCHVAAEGKAGAAQTHYGGDNDADSSGVLNYFIVKHTGAQVEEDNELNGISFNAVGSGTEVDFIQTYATFDDGIEMFGGAVNIGHYVGLYVRDDSIDIDEGYNGTIDYALVIQSETDGNRCVESDGIGSYSSLDQTAIDSVIARGLNSRATIKNLTCIVSPTEVVGNPGGTGTHDPGQGLRIREAHFPTIENAVITTAYAAETKLGDDDYNYCVRIDNEGQQAALDGTLVIEQSVIACQDLVDSDLVGQSTLDWLNLANDTTQTAEDGSSDPTAAAEPNLVILDGFFSVPLADMVINGGPVTAVPTDSRTFIGAVTAADNWTAGWAYGLEDGNRGQPLWFE